MVRTKAFRPESMKGIYILVISIEENTRVNIGALGPVVFEKGLYAYVGSAQNNVEKRVQRHLSKHNSKFWHIDYLLSNRQAEVVKVFFKNAGRVEECRIARRLAETAVSLRAFGSSDCTCRSHLFRVEDYDYLSEFMLEIGLKPLSKTVPYRSKPFLGRKV